jgi:hypothetical protein
VSLTRRKRGKYDLDEFGGKVWTELERQGRSREWLQAQLSVSRSTLYRLLTGKSKLSLGDILSVAHVLGVDAAVITPADFGRAEDETQAEAPADSKAEDTFGADVEEIIATLARSLDSRAMRPAAALAALNGVEEAARIEGRNLPSLYWDLRRAVHESLAGSKTRDARS